MIPISAEQLQSLYHMAWKDFVAYSKEDINTRQYLNLAVLPYWERVLRSRPEEATHLLSEYLWRWVRFYPDDGGPDCDPTDEDGFFQRFMAECKRLGFCLS